MDYRLAEGCIHSNLATTELLECMDVNTEILKHFRSDLYTDFVWLVHKDGHKTPETFWWVVRDCGTWLHKIRHDKQDDKFIQLMVDNYSRYQVYEITHHACNNWSIKREFDTLFEGLLDYKYEVNN